MYERDVFYFSTQIEAIFTNLLNQSLDIHKGCLHKPKFHRFTMICQVVDDGSQFPSTDEEWTPEKSLWPYLGWLKRNSIYLWAKEIVIDFSNLWLVQGRNFEYRLMLQFRQQFQKSYYLKSTFLLIQIQYIIYQKVDSVKIISLFSIACSMCI